MEYETQKKSSGVAKAGLTLGIIGTSLAALGGAAGAGFLGMNNRCGDWGRGGWNHRETDHYQNIVAEKDSEIAELKSMRYTDQIGVELYQAIVSKSNADDAKIAALHTELYQYVMDLDKRTALNEQAAKFQREYDQLARDTQFAILSNKVDNLNEKQTTIGNFNKQLGELSDAAIISYVNSTFYPAKMVIPASAICPPVVTQ